MTRPDERDPTAGLRALLGVKFAMAHAELDEALAAPAAAEIASFLPLAAATGTAELPERISAREDESLVIGVARRADGLTLQVTALGFVRAQELAGRRALLRTPDGVVAYEFRFDATGHAEVRLADTAETRAALLAGWSVVIGR